MKRYLLLSLLSYAIALAVGFYDPASAQYTQPFRANVNGTDRLFIPGNPPRSPVAIDLVNSTTSPYSVNQGWVRISNTKNNVLTVQGQTPTSGTIPTGAGNPGDIINAGTTGVFYWSGLGNLVETLTVERSITLTRTSNACGVASFSPTATRPLGAIDIGGVTVQFSQLPSVAASYCRQGVLYVPQ
jgi:hypothetical protein